MLEPTRKTNYVLLTYKIANRTVVILMWELPEVNFPVPKRKLFLKSYYYHIIFIQILNGVPSCF